MPTTPIRQFVLMLFLCLGTTLPAQAQNSPNWARDMFDTQKVDFGVIARASDARQMVKIHNKYNSQLHISNVRTTCGCSYAKPTKTYLQPGESVGIEVTMNTNKFKHRKDSNLIVTFDSPRYAEVRIPITAYIRTDVVLSPGSVNFGTIDQGKTGERTIDIAYAGRDNWKINSVKTGSKLLVAKLETVNRGARRVNYKLHMTLDPSTPAGNFLHRIYLMTDDERSPMVPVIVKARVEADITVSTVSFGRMKPGQTKTVRVVMKGKKNFKVEKIECESNTDAYQYKMPEGEKRVHIFPLVFKSPEKAGKFAEKFTVTIPGRPQPVTFVASGNVVDPNAPVIQQRQQQSSYAPRVRRR